MSYRSWRYTLVTTGNNRLRIWNYKESSAVPTDEYPLEARDYEDDIRGQIRQKQVPGISYHLLNGDRGWIEREKVDRIEFVNP